MALMLAALMGSVSPPGISIVLRVCSVVVLSLLVVSGAAISGPYDAYRPYSHPYPQIIQADDYPSIEAIEALVRDLKGIGSDIVSCATTDAITFAAKSGRKLVVLTPSGAPVVLSTRRFESDKTIALFTTLARLLYDLPHAHACTPVLVDQFGTRAYRRRSIVEFDIGSHILALDALSNGPHDGERLYVLDVVERKESTLFWRPIPELQPPAHGDFERTLQPAAQRER